MVSDELRHAYEAAIRKDIPRTALVEIAEMFPIAATQGQAVVSRSKEVVERGVNLAAHRAAKAAGLMRHHYMDESFEQVLTRHGGEIVTRIPLDLGSAEPKEARVYLTTGKFGGSLLGFASHREPTDLPLKNMTRSALCTLNAGLIGDLFRPLEAFETRDRFVLILARRDPVDIGKIASLTLSIIDPRYAGFVVQSDLNSFLAGYGERRKSARSNVKLRPGVKRFKDGKGPDSSSAAG